MSITSAADVGSPGVPGVAGSTGPRVRHLAREAVVLMAFSAGASTALAGCLLLLTTLGRQG
ncbi:MAG: hypothetical protein ACRDO4_14765 [Nocardioides sp.]